jgi:hypothetical protein
VDITTLAAWGAFLGGIAVVVSLIYLASQIRQNSRLLRVSATVALGESDTELMKMAVEDPEVWRILLEGYENRDALPPPEKIRLDAYLDMMIRAFQRNYFIAQDGVMKTALWEGDVRGNAWVLRQPGPRQWWREQRFTYCDEFAEFVDGLIREGEAAG